MADVPAGKAEIGTPRSEAARKPSRRGRMAAILDRYRGKGGKSTAVAVQRWERIVARQGVPRDLDFDEFEKRLALSVHLDREAEFEEIREMMRRFGHDAAISIVVREGKTWNRRALSPEMQDKFDASVLEQIVAKAQPLLARMRKSHLYADLFEDERATHPAPSLCQ